MKRLMQGVGGLILCALLLVQQHGADAQATLNRLEWEEVGFSMTYPGGWSSGELLNQAGRTVKIIVDTPTFAITDFADLNDIETYVTIESIPVALMGVPLADNIQSIADGMQLGEITREEIAGRPAIRANGHTKALAHVGYYDYVAFETQYSTYLVTVFTADNAFVPVVDMLCGSIEIDDTVVPVYPLPSAMPNMTGQLPVMPTLDPNLMMPGWDMTMPPLSTDDLDMMLPSASNLAPPYNDYNSTACWDVRRHYQDALEQVAFWQEQIADRQALGLSTGSTLTAQMQAQDAVFRWGPASYPGCH